MLLTVVVNMIVGPYQLKINIEVNTVMKRYFINPGMKRKMIKQLLFTIVVYLKEQDTHP